METAAYALRAHGLESASELSGVSCKGTIPIMGGSMLLASSNPSHLPKAPSPSNTLGLRASMNEWGHTAQSVAHQLWRISEKFPGGSAGVGAQGHFFSPLPELGQSERCTEDGKGTLSSSAGAPGGGDSAPWAGPGLSEPPGQEEAVGSLIWKWRVSSIWEPLLY